jgi:hypothetical protein
VLMGSNRWRFIVDSQTIQKSSSTAKSLETQTFTSDSDDVYAPQRSGYKASPESIWRIHMASTKGNSWLAIKRGFNTSTRSEKIRY